MKKTIKSLLQRFTVIISFIAITSLLYAAGHYFSDQQLASHYIQQASRALLDNKNSLAKRALFSPDDKIQHVLIGLIDAEKERIRMAAYSLTDSFVAAALVRAHNRKVWVEVIFDAANSLYDYSKIPFLKAHHLALWKYPSVKFNKRNKKSSVGIMHNKFVIFNKTIGNKALLWTGSYNFTRSANDRNQENVVIEENPQFIGHYSRQFEIIKKRCVRA